MKRYAVLFSFLLLSLALITPPTAVSLTLSDKRWALIAIAHYEFEFSTDAYELRDALEHYSFSGIKFMSY